MKSKAARSTAPPPAGPVPKLRDGAGPAGSGAGRRTRQRQLVLDAVRASEDHPTAAQVFQRVRRRYPGIAYATIYNALRWWVERGELREFTFGDAAARYDRNRDRHDHAICTRCGRLMDVSVRLPGRLLNDVRRRTGLEIASHHVQFLGLCSACAATKEARTVRG